MRSGAELVASNTVRKLNINAIVKRLEMCSQRCGGCSDCPDLKVCVDAYDERCNLEAWTEPK